MKKRTKSVITGVCGLLFATTLCLGIKSAGDVTSASPKAVYAVQNVNALSVTTTPEYFSDYAVGERISINAIETVIDGNQTSTYAVLQKDGDVKVLLTPEMEQTTYRFTETGSYNLIYYTNLPSGEKNIVKNFVLSVGEQPYFDVVFQSKYLVNETISVKATCLYGSLKTDATVVVYSPLATEMPMTDGMVKLTECGKYNVVYTATLNGETVSRNYYFTVEGSSEKWADYIYNVSGVTEIEENSSAPDYAVDGTGLRVTGGAFTTFRYNNVIDLNTISSTENLLNLLPLSSDGYSSLSKLYVRLIDVYDETNNIAYEYSYENVKDPFTYCKLSYKDILKSRKGAGLEGFYENTIYGMTPGGVHFDVETWGNTLNQSGILRYGNMKWLRMQTDYSQKKFYITTGKIGQADMQDELLDLDDPTHVGYGNEWAGFTTGEVYVQIELIGRGSQTGVIIQEIAGEKMYGVKTSTKAPGMLFEVEKDGVLPTGEVGKYYPFPAVYYSVDAMDGRYVYPDYELVNFEKALFDGLKYESVLLDTKDGFTPTEAGVYRLTYQITDEHGNVNQRKITFKVVDTLGDFGVAYDVEMKNAYSVGTHFVVPELTPSGGLSYLTYQEESIVYNGGEYADQIGEKIFLNAPGNIVVKALYKDYLGNTYEYEKSYPVTVSQTPITEMKGVVPKYVLKDREIVLPELSAINYSKDETSAEYKPNWTLLVDGQNVSTTERNVAFTKNHGEISKVQYLLNGEPVYESDVTIVEAKYLSDRFYVKSGTFEKSDGSDGVTLSTTSNGSIDFINPLFLDENTTNLPFAFSVTAEKGAFEYIDVYFQDYVYTDVEIFVRLTFTENGLYGQVNGVGEKLLLSYSKQYSDYEMQYNATLKAFEFSTRQVIKLDCNGAKFNGFVSKRINVRFEFKGVTGETALKIRKFGTMSMASLLDWNGVAQEYRDKTIPVVVSERSFRENSFVYGSTAILPAVEVRNVLSGLTTAKVTVISPSGKTIIDAQNAYNDYTFVITEYGEYKIRYTITYLSTQRQNTYTVRVFKEELAEITLAKPLSEKYAKGASIAVPEILTTGTGEDVEMTCYIIAPDRTRKKVVAGDTVTLTQIGTYQLQVLVQDEYNAIFEMWQFKVEG